MYSNLRQLTLTCTPSSTTPLARNVCGRFCLPTTTLPLVIRVTEGICAHPHPLTRIASGRPSLPTTTMTLPLAIRVTEGIRAHHHPLPHSYHEWRLCSPLHSQFK